MTTHYNLKNIRTLLTEGFTDKQLRRLCYDIPSFKPVYDELAQNSGKGEIIDQLLEHAGRTLQIEILLTLAKEYNPARYERHQPYYEIIPNITLSNDKTLNRKNKYYVFFLLILVAILMAIFVFLLVFRNGYLSIFLTPEHSSPPPMPLSVLQVDNRLQIGQELRSPNGRFSARLQIDGNFVLYRDGKPIWATNTVDSKAEFVDLQRDGNLVLYTYDDIPVWASQTASDRLTDNCVLQLLDDGNLVILRDGAPIWETGTNP